jgi:hypothetical protein
MLTPLTGGTRGGVGQGSRGAVRAAQGGGDELLLAASPDLAQDRFHVIAHGVAGQEQPLRDLVVGQAVQHQPGELAFACGQPVRLQHQVGDLRTGPLQGNRGVPGQVRSGEARGRDRHPSSGPGQRADPGRGRHACALVPAVVHGRRDRKNRGWRDAARARGGVGQLGHPPFGVRGDRGDGKGRVEDKHARPGIRPAVARSSGRPGTACTSRSSLATRGASRRAKSASLMLNRKSVLSWAGGSTRRSVSGAGLSGAVCVRRRRAG